MSQEMRIQMADPEVVPRAKRRQFSARYKLRTLEEAENCAERGHLGALLRREGLYSCHLATWRRQREKGQLEALSPKRRGPKLRGYNHRLDTIQAAVLRVKLKHLEAWNAARRQHAELYDELLAGSPVATPAEADYAESVYHLYVIRVKACPERSRRNRDGLRACLHDRGIATGIHYPIPIHLQPAYRDLGYEDGSFPVTEEYAGQILSLPMYAELSPNLIEHVGGAIGHSVSEYSVERPIAQPAC